MTRDDIIRMLQKCGFGTLADHPIMTENMVRFAALVAAAEREACANVCYTLGNDSSIDDHAYEAFREAEEAIRARGEVKS